MNRHLSAALFASLCGCGGPDEGGDATGSLGPPVVHPVPGCEGIDHRPCDIVAESCRERLMDLTACLRGSDRLPVPPVTIMTPADYANIVNARLAEDPPPDPNHYERALTLLDLVEPGELSQTVIGPDDVGVYGQYRFDEKDILVVDHGDEDQAVPTLVLVHEFVHALQDGDIDLAGREDEATSYDSYLGFGAVIEGEARLHELRLVASLLGLNPAEIDWRERFQSSVELGEASLLEEGSVYSNTWGYFPYTIGSRYMHHAWLESGRAGVLELLSAPHPSTRAVMESVEDIALDDWPAPVLEAPEPASPFALWGEESLGAWGMFMVLSRLGTATAAHVVAREWRGDRLFIFADEESGETVMAWHVELASVEAATRFEVMVRPVPAAIARSENRVALASASGTSAVDWAL